MQGLVSLEQGRVYKKNTFNDFQRNQIYVGVCVTEQGLCFSLHLVEDEVLKFPLPAFQ